MTVSFRLTISRERCKGCELCVAVCPNGVLTMSNDFNSKMNHVACATHPEACTGCKRCTDICPDAAIEIDASDPAKARTVKPCGEGL